MSAGYSGTPLAGKLGIKPEMVSVFLNAPDSYFSEISVLPNESEMILPECIGCVDFIHSFHIMAEELRASFPALKAVLRKNGMLWISWPKKSAKTASDIDENLLREIGLAAGLVDVKVCAVDATWSGLKFVYRKADR